jgi:ABC-type sugar transport system ATPase subunit
MLGKAAPPLVAEPEDRAGGPGGRERPKRALARLIAFARPRKSKAAAAIMEAGSAEAEPEFETVLANREDEDARADTIVVPAAGATAVANEAEMGVGRAGPATAASKPDRPLFALKGAIAVVLMTGVAAAAIVVLNWPHGSHPQAVEPGMLADQPTKVMAPSAALATVPPREEPNVAGERPRLISGLETPTAGRILFGKEDVTRLPTRRRNVGMVFQYPVMYPTLSVEENIELPLKEDRGLSADERKRRVVEILETLDMRDLRRSFIEDLDAGARQKVAIGRAIARKSAIVLFDEPTTSLEVNAKLQLICAIKAVIQRTRQTIVYVTHDQTEAMTLADRIALMQGGRIIQYDRPDQLYNEPLTEFGGWFLGNPGMNFVPAAISGDGICAPLLAQPLPTPPNLKAGQVLKVGVRPEWIVIHDEPHVGSVPGMLVDQTIGIAGRYLARVAVGDVEVKVKTDGRRAAMGQAVYLEVPREKIMLYADGAQVAE